MNNVTVLCVVLRMMLVFFRKMTDANNRHTTYAKYGSSLHSIVIHSLFTICDFLLRSQSHISLLSIVDRLDFVPQLLYV
jgi:hypothetical protein